MEDYAERIVGRAIDLGCQDAVADVSVNRSYQIRFAQNQIVISNRWRETTASAFLVYKKRVVASDIKDFTRLDAQVDNLVKIAKASQENPDYGGIAKGPFKYDRLSVDKKIVDLSDGYVGILYVGRCLNRQSFDVLMCPVELRRHTVKRCH